MKHPDSRTGLSRFSLTRNADGIDVPDFPKDPGKSHAVIDHPRSPHSRMPYRSITDTTDTDFDWEYTAECGATVRTLLTIRFNDADPDACKTCATLMAARAEGDDAYRKAKSDLYKRQSQARAREDERAREREDINAWNRAQNRRMARRAFPNLSDGHDPEV